MLEELPKIDLHLQTKSSVELAVGVLDAGRLSTEEPVEFRARAFALARRRILLRSFAFSLRSSIFLSERR